MTSKTLIALVAGARETRDAAEWLAATAAEVIVVWAQGAVRVDLGFAEDGAVPPTARGILDVTHAFDTRTRNRAVTAAPDAGYARIARRLWTPVPQDDWTIVDTIEAAVAALPCGARVFAATGGASLGALSAHDGPVFLRQLSDHDRKTGHAHCHYVFSSAPFDAAGEAALFRDLRIDVVLARNIGGAGSFPKLAAARALGLPVVLLRPPAVPVGPHLQSQKEVAEWVAGL